MGDSLRPYCAYKGSGLSWLESIPAHWDEERVKYLFREIDDHSRTGSETVLSMSQVHGLVPSTQLAKPRIQSESVVGSKLCQKDDLVLNRLKAHLGVFAHARQGGIVSPDYSVYRRVHSGDTRYFELLFKTPLFVTELRRSTKGIVEGFWRLYTDDFYNIRVPVPPPCEQAAIAAWAARFDAQVHKFIRNKRRLIELLNEQKQAIINQAVTRGLDPNVQFKPSGVDWLGEVPEHWLSKPLKQWTQMNARTLPESTDGSFRFRYIDIGCVGTGLLVESPQWVRFSDSPSRARRVLKKGDTIISTVRTYLKAVYFVSEDVDDLVATTGFAVLTPRSGIVSEYLSYVIQSSSFVERVTAHSVGIAYPAISETRLGVFYVAMPPTEREQLCIVEQVKASTQAISNAIQRAQTGIELVREYRTRLIADVVTGKLDVRQVVSEDVEFLTDGAHDNHEVEDLAEDGFEETDISEPDTETDDSAG